MAIRYWDPENGDDANDATTFAQAIKTPNGLSGKVSAGDTVRVLGSVRSAVSGCVVTNGSQYITPPAGNHKLLDMGTDSTKWTTQTNVSTTASATLDGEGIRINVSNSFTTGKAAHITFDTPIDVTDFSALCLGLYISRDNQEIRIDLCSDADGDVSIASFTIHSEGTLNRGVMLPYGSTFSTFARSLSITVLNDIGGFYIYTGRLGVCHDPYVKPDAITPRTYFSQSNRLSEIFEIDSGYWMCLASYVEDDDRMLMYLHSASGLYRGLLYYPESSSSDATLYLWHNLQTDWEFNRTLPNVGNYENLVTLEGGYNRSDMSYRDPDGLSVFANIQDNRGLAGNRSNYYAFRYMGIIGSYGFGKGGDRYSLRYCVFNETTVSTRLSIEDCVLIGMRGACTAYYIHRCKAQGSITIHNDYDFRVYDTIEYANPVITFISRIFTSGKQLENWLLGYSHRNIIEAANEESTEAISLNEPTVFMQYKAIDSNLIGTGAPACILKVWGAYDQELQAKASAADHISIQSQETIARSGRAIQIQVNQVGPVPLRYRVGVTRLRSGVVAQLSIWIRRTQSDLVVSFGGEMISPSYEVTSRSAAAGAIDTWEQLSVTFTPTNDGICVLFVETYGNPDSTDDMSFTSTGIDYNYQGILYLDDLEVRQ